jgi:hypothetical protein
MMMPLLVVLISSLLWPMSEVTAFLLAQPYPANQHRVLQLQAAFELTIDMPPSGSGLQANMAIDPILSVPSELVVVRYKVPFGLNGMYEYCIKMFWMSHGKMVGSLTHPT